MDGAKAVECLQDAALCNLCWELFNEPVTLECGHNYCSRCILQYWGGASASCPQCKVTLLSSTLKSNRQLGNLAWLIKQIKLQEVVVVRKRGLCEIHTEPLVLFCKKDEIFLCPVCGESHARGGHSVVASLESVAEDYKHEITVILGVQKLRRESFRAASADVRLEKQHLVRLMDEGVQKLSLEYKELLDLMKAIQAEQQDLATLIVKEADEELSKLYKTRCNMKKFSSDLQKKRELPARELLMDIKETMSKCREEVRHPLDLKPPDLKEKLWDFSHRNLFMLNTLRKCRETLPLKLNVERAHVTLDEATAFSQLLLSEDKKRVTNEALVYCPVTDPLRFDTTSCVLGSEGFTSGRYYWEAEITSQGEGWALGIAKESVNRKGAIILGRHEGIWALQPEGSALLWRKAGTVKIRVYLDYEAGDLEFFASSRDLIASFPSLCFAGERVFPFFMLEKQVSQIKLCF